MRKRLPIWLGLVGVRASREYLGVRSKAVYQDTEQVVWGSATFVVLSSTRVVLTSTKKHSKLRLLPVPLGCRVGYQ